MKNTNVISIDPSTEKYRKKINIMIEGSNNRIIIGKNVVVKGSLNIAVEGNESLVCIGDNTTFENTTIELTEDNNFVEIGKDCMFAKGTELLASDYHSIIDINNGLRINNEKGIKIKNHVWLATDSLVLKNTFIDDNSIVGARCVASGNYGKNTLIAGIPGRVIKNNVSWDRELLINNNDLCIKNLKESNKIDYYLENKISNSNSFVEGWAVLKESNSLDDKIIIAIIPKHGKTFYYQSRKIDSSDVAKHYNNKYYSYCRFSAFINNDINYKKVLLIIVSKTGNFYVDITNDFKEVNND